MAAASVSHVLSAFLLSLGASEEKITVPAGTQISRLFEAVGVSRNYAVGEAESLVVYMSVSLLRKESSVLIDAFAQIGSATISNANHLRLLVEVLYRGA